MLKDYSLQLKCTNISSLSGRLSVSRSIGVGGGRRAGWISVWVDALVEWFLGLEIKIEISILFILKVHAALHR